jgi:hypothetical protein
VLRVMRECPGYSFKQLLLVIRNVPQLKSVSEGLVKDIFEDEIVKK